LKGSFSDQQQSEGSQFRSFSVEIPIPAIPPDVDVTEEAWFENEREGSLDQATLSMIQRQLFGQHGYIPEHHDMMAHRRSDDIPISTSSNVTTPIHNDSSLNDESSLQDQWKSDLPLNISLDPTGTPLSVSASTLNNDLESPLPFHLDMSPARAKNDDVTPQSIQHGDGNASEESFATDSKHNSLVPGLASPTVLTPPHRTKHKNHFLVQAGLLPEGKSKLFGNVHDFLLNLQSNGERFLEAHSPSTDVSNSEQVRLLVYLMCDILT
jgi:hypothetical protein